MNLNESHVEDAALAWFEKLGYTIGHGPLLAPGEPESERTMFSDVILADRCQEAIRQLNPHMPAEAQEDALRKVSRLGTPSLTQTNRAFHRMLRDGVDVEYPRPDGSIAGDHARLVDFSNVDANDWFAVNQFTVIEGQQNRRPDIVVFVNGLPLGLIELKNAADEDATIWSAYSQVQTYKSEIPSLLQYNAALVLSDGLEARIGSLTANQEWFKVWRTIDGEGDAPKTALELEVMIRGVFERQRFLDLIQHFIVFEENPDNGAIHKIIVGYHQFHAVNAAVEETIRASTMVVYMSRRICVDLFQALIKLRPDWSSAKDDDTEVENSKECVVKVVMTGSAEDGPVWQPHIRNKDKRRKLANRFKDSKDPFRIVIVRDMWLTGFDAPCLHTMYADKPMQGHGLMQAIARVNRVFRDKPGGLVVDYLGLADQLRQALATYTESGGQGDPTFDTAQVIAVMLEKHSIVCDMLHGFSWAKWSTGTPTERLSLIPAGQEQILEQDDGKNRFIPLVTELSRAFALCAASDEATTIRDDLSFFQAIQAALNKRTGGSKKTPDQLDAAVRQLVSSAITTDGQVIDVFTAAGLKKPDISILDDRFLAEVRGLKHKNVAAELLEKLLKDELKARSKRNLVQSQLFSEKLKKTLNASHNRAIATQEVIEELIKLAKEMDAATKRGKDLGLTDDEIAFYDALTANESAVQAMGDDKLKLIAVELITQVRRQEDAVKTVLQQAELLCVDWTVQSV